MKIITRIYVAILFTLASATWAQSHTGHGPPPPPKKTKAKEELRVSIDIAPSQQQKIGLKTSTAQKKAIQHEINTVGVVATDQSKEIHIHTRVSGWIEQIHADYIGKTIAKGDPLFDLYSPEVFATEQEYVAAKKQGSATKEIANGALERLRLWNISEKEIARLRKTVKAARLVRFDSPSAGYIISKNAIQGMYVTPELETYYIADLSEVWVQITLYQFDVASIKSGDKAVVTLPYDSKAHFLGTIDFISPEIDKQSRSARARVKIPNVAQTLKPGMLANITVNQDLGTAIVIPDDAIIDTGPRQLVFVKKNASVFEPREISIGARTALGRVVLKGLKEGEEVVTSAQFLIDAESKMQSALKKMPAATDAQPKKPHTGH